MKNTKTKRTVILTASLIAVALILLGGFWFSYSRFTVKGLLARLPSEVAEIPAVSVRSELYCNDKTVPIGYLMYRVDQSRPNQKNGSISYKETFCVYDERAYFLYADTTNSLWVIASIHVDSLELRDECAFHTEQSYLEDREKDYRDRNGYYYEGSIVLNDKDRVLVFDIASSEKHEYSYSEYTFPVPTVRYTQWTPNSIELEIDSNLKTYSLNSMAKHSSGIEKISLYQDKKMWNGDFCLSNFFGNNSVQVVDGEIYAVGELRDSLGEAYAIVLQLHDGKWRYVDAFHSSDYVNGKCFVIPILKSKDGTSKIGDGSLCCHG